MVKAGNNNYPYPLIIRLNKSYITALVILAASGQVSAEASDSRRAEALAFNCFTCHGTNGKSPGAMKSLDKLSAGEIRDKLKAFKRDENNPTIMNRIAKGYSDDEIAIIADYIANLD